ncbi:HAMP domain-containing histidine kinase [Calothrix anomala FACHB-343]|uniref:histidine kinase n=3 Tax=Calotrichaceae TaxID=2661849 RepID=A0ABR8A544_9CYAN|nr:HAMP domain-containing histidine kinase [Calothrix parietina FACHB-288]MBD2223679.1 HAMP domain-containing histidine kinase [Calothrix anomala FACHB-343]
MPTSVIFLKKKFPTFVQWFSIAKWQYIYYALAAFDLLTVSSSLYLNHKIMDIYTQSIVVNHEWAVRLERYSELGQLLADVNAPGNDVFDSQDVNLESKRLATAKDNFEQKFNSIKQELQTQVDPAQVEKLLKDLDSVQAATTEMVAEAKLIFSYFRENQPEMAGKRMATMDRQYHKVNKALAIFRRNVSQIQQQLLQQEKVAANVFRYYEFAIAGAMLLMVASVTFYGHQLAQKMKSDAQEKEKSIAELQQAEARLREQTQQLQLTLDNLQKAQLQLVQSEKMSSLGELVAGVAHEINNPVNFIHGNLTYLEDYANSLLAFIRLYQKFYPKAPAEIQAEAEEMDLEFLQKDLVKILNSMKIGTDRIREIVLSLRNFSRMDEADFKTVDIHEGIDSTLLILQHRLKARSPYPAIEIIKDYGNLPQVECYAGQLNQVFMNILSNAIDAMEEQNSQRTVAEIKAQPSQITIRTSVIDSQWVEIAIADNGVGIPENIQQRIFDPFFTTKPVGKGTGMGMSISYQIITEKHRGKLTCFSTLGEGTEFVIQIPIHQQVQK